MAISLDSFVSIVWIVSHCGHVLDSNVYIVYVDRPLLLTMCVVYIAWIVSHCGHVFGFCLFVLIVSNCGHVLGFCCLLCVVRLSLTVMFVVYFVWIVSHCGHVWILMSTLCGSRLIVAMSLYSFVYITWIEHLSGVKHSKTFKKYFLTCKVVCVCGTSNHALAIHQKSYHSFQCV